MPRVRAMNALLPVLSVMAVSATALLWAGDEKPAADPPIAGASHDSAGQYNEVLGQWKQVVCQLDILRRRYRSAEPDQRMAMKREHTRLVSEGEALATRLLDAAEKILRETPKIHAQVQVQVDVATLLAQVVVENHQTENYEEALRMANLLIEREFDEKLFYVYAGIAAFCVGQSDLAEEYLVKSKGCVELANPNRFPRRTKHFTDLANRRAGILHALPEFRELWAAEQQLREAEDQWTGDERLPRVRLSTNKGDIELVLFEKEAPNTVANFISLVEKGYYDGLTFHRVVSQLAAQAGCNRGDGSGGPGYRIPCECYEPNHRNHFRGSLSMAKTAFRDTGGAQFFITFLPTMHLNGKHTVFGRVVKGMDVVTKLQHRDPTADNAADPDTIEKAEVLFRRKHPYPVKKIGP